VATHADRGVYEQGKWTLEGIRQSVIGKDGVSVRNIVAADWQLGFEPELAKVISTRLARLSISGLLRYIDYLRSNGLDTASYELALWSKIVHPLSTAVMIFIALPLVLGRLGSVGIGQRIFAGIVIAVSFLLLEQIAAHVGLNFGLNPVVAACAPTLLFFALAVWMFHRVS
jgi:lipopolysaccharide export system permease protein